jgi:hypothetical protein
MARNIKQSTQGLSAAAKSLCAIRWDTDLEKQLAKLRQPALFQALHIAVECSIGQAPWISDKLDVARANPHQFTEDCFPLDMPAVYEAYTQYDSELQKKGIIDPDFIPTLSGYVAWLVLSKLWRLCDSVTTSAKQVYEPATVIEITNICLLAEHAQRILHSEERAESARPLLILMKFGKVDHRSKEYKRKCRRFWNKAEESVFERYFECADTYPSLEAAAMAVSEMEVLPFDFLQCFQMLESMVEHPQCR